MEQKDGHCRGEHDEKTELYEQQKMKYDEECTLNRERFDQFLERNARDIERWQNFITHYNDNDIDDLDRLEEESRRERARRNRLDEEEKKVIDDMDRYIAMKQLEREHQQRLDEERKREDEREERLAGERQEEVRRRNEQYWKEHAEARQREAESEERTIAELYQSKESCLQSAERVRRLEEEKLVMLVELGHKFKEHFDRHF